MAIDPRGVERRTRIAKTNKGNRQAGRTRDGIAGATRGRRSTHVSGLDLSLVGRLEPEADIAAAGERASRVARSHPEATRGCTDPTRANLCRLDYSLRFPTSGRAGESARDLSRARSPARASMRAECPAGRARVAVDAIRRRARACALHRATPTWIRLQSSCSARRPRSNFIPPRPGTSLIKDHARSADLMYLVRFLET